MPKTSGCTISFSVLIVVSLFLGTTVEGYTVNDTETLLTNLFTGYNKNVIPTPDSTIPLEISALMYLMSLQEFDEIAESLSAVTVIRFRWKDSKITWDPSQYGGLSTFSMPYTDVWVPGFVILLNPAEDMDPLGKSWQKVWYMPDGTATWMAGGSVKSSCPVDVSKYPFDSQSCSLEFVAFGHSSDIIILTAESSTVETLFYTPNGRWTLTGTDVSNYSPGSLPKVTFTFHLARKSMFVVFNIILPIIFLSVLNALVFIQPIESGERVSYSITCLLAIAVFMTIVGDTLPKNSDPMAYIAYILMIELAFSVLITVCTLLNMRLYYKPEAEEVPVWMEMLIRPRCRKNPVTPHATVGELDIVPEFDTKQTKIEGSCSVKSSEELEEVKASWKDGMGNLHTSRRYVGDSETDVDD